MLKRLILNTLYLLLGAPIRFKWLLDKKELPLISAHYPLYKRIHRHSFRARKRFPKIVNPETINDKVQWFKLFGQEEKIVECTDKIAVRDFVKQRVGSDVLTKLYLKKEAAGHHFPNLKDLPKRFVLKSNNDSGSVYLVRDKDKSDLEKIWIHLQESSKDNYGWQSGEWAYEFIEPQIFAEELLAPEAESPPSDYKLHCSEGKVKFCRVISDRGVDTNEIVVDRNFQKLDFIINEKLIKRTSVDKPNNWSEMVHVAEQLSAGFRMVRIDLYCIEQKIVFGEMTFFPGSGFYPGDGQKEAGALLDFDKSIINPPLIAD